MVINPHCNKLIQLGNFFKFSAKPSMVLNVKVSEVASSSCFLSWDTPIDNGGSTIMSYIIQKRELDRKAWVKVFFFIDMR